jgi:hypothetical protein
MYSFFLFLLLISCSNSSIERDYPVNDNRVNLLQRQGSYGAVKFEHNINSKQENKLLCDRNLLFKNLSNDLQKKYLNSSIDYDLKIFNSTWFDFEERKIRFIIFVKKDCMIDVNIFEKNKNDNVVLVIDDFIRQKILETIDNKENDSIKR